MSGKPVNYLESPGFKDWVAAIKKKKNAGVRVINLHVIDLPISDYFKFGIGFLRISEQNGQESRFAERRNVHRLLEGIQDFYLFDSRTVMLVNYDNKGNFLNLSTPITNSEVVSRSLLLSNELTKLSIPMEIFIRQNNIDLTPKPALKRTKARL